MASTPPASGAAVTSAARQGKATSWLAGFAVLVLAAFLVGNSGHFRLGGALGAAAFLILSGIWSGIIGKDGQFSASKLQLLLWNTAFAYCYLSYWFLARKFPALATPEMPEWLWAAIGLSSSTALAAKGITVGQISRAQLQDTTTSDVASAANDSAAARLGALVTNDDGVPDITRIQMLFWTVVGVIVVALGASAVVSAVEAAVRAGDLQAGINRFHYPHVDLSLIVLAGIGQGVYLGNKLFDSEKPLIVGITPSVVAAGDVVCITGSGFGDRLDEGQVQIDGVPIELMPVKSPPANPHVVWSDTKIQFAMPNSLGGNSWTPGVPVRVRVLVRQVPSANEGTLALR